MILSRDHVEGTLSNFPPRDTRPLVGMKRAAVAILLRYDRSTPDVLLMKRAARKNDRWSGQISFPGGREEPEDPTLLYTAIRETREEVGFDLHQAANPLAQLETMRARSSGGILPMSVTPFVFIQTQDHPLTLGPEAADAFWFPLDRALAGEFSGEVPYKIGGVTSKLPCWNYQGYTVWGMTYYMTQQLIRVLEGQEQHQDLPNRYP
jgi:8-oxo-dGTP pyrophosphatase MutT (NUDIX family)